MEIQINFGFEIVDGRKETLFLITDAERRYTEGCVTESRDLKKLCKLIEILWILRHGASTALAADGENKLLLRC